MGTRRIRYISIIISFVILISLISPIVEARTYQMNISLEKSDASFIGKKGTNVGSSMEIVGDLNGDGYDDIIISSYGTSKGQPGSYIFFGKAVGWVMDTKVSKADVIFIGSRAITSIGDINGDGLGDLLLEGVDWKNTGEDPDVYFWIIPGKTGGWSKTIDLWDHDPAFIEYNARSSHAIIGKRAGDVNGDGYDDVMIRNYSKIAGTDPKFVYMLNFYFGRIDNGGSGFNLSTANFTIVSPIKGVNEISRAGDVNDDGFDDILINVGSAPHPTNQSSQAGTTFLILGRNNWTRYMPMISEDISEMKKYNDVLNLNINGTDLTPISIGSYIGEDVEDQSGQGLSTAGDVNKDGFDDFLIGAGESKNGKGETYLILGKKEGWGMNISLANADASFIGENEQDFAGRDVAGAGDINGDGYDDILIGATGNHELFRTNGETYIIFGKSQGWSMRKRLSSTDGSFRGEREGTSSGSSVSIGGDVNGDGLDDILIGALEDDEYDSNSGQIYLILGPKKDMGFFENPLILIFIISVVIAITVWIIYLRRSPRRK